MGDVPSRAGYKNIIASLPCADAERLQTLIRFTASPTYPLRRRTLLMAGVAAAGSATYGSSPEAVPCTALLIGNSRYQSNAVLNNPATDMALLAPALRSLGATTQVALDLGREQLAATIHRFLKSMEAQRIAVWVSYSGHAVQVDGRNYLLGVDSRFESEAEVRSSGYDLDELLRRIAQVNPRAAVVTVDACRNNPFRPPATRGIQPTGLAKVDSAGLFVGFSTAPYTKALDGSDAAGSPYARALVAALGKRPRSLEEVFSETADTVYRQTGAQQVPEYRSSMRAGWWFGATGIELRSTPSTRMAAGGASTQAATREVGYRPDLPRQALPPEGRETTDWNAEDMALQRAVARMDQREARRALDRGQAAHASLYDTVLAGMLAESGSQVERNLPMAAKLYRRAAERGHVPAQTLLGELQYALGNWADAYKWLTLAADRGVARAQLDLGQLKLEGRGAQRDIPGAMDQFKAVFQQQMLNAQGAHSPEDIKRLQKSLSLPSR